MRLRKYLTGESGRRRIYEPEIKSGEGCRGTDGGRRAGTDLDAWYLLEYVTGVSRAAYFADPDRELTEAQQEAFDACVKKRVGGSCPAHHRTQEFMGLSFRVNEHVLIPRQDTEILVEEALEMLKKRAVPTENRDGQTTEILDLCTGSGCILLSVLHYAGQKEHMNLRGTGSDLSGQALETARGNAEHLGIRAHFVQSDLFGSLPGRYAMILSNPPYIRSGDLEELQPGSPVPRSGDGAGRRCGRSCLLPPDHRGKSGSSGGRDPDA